MRKSHTDISLHGGVRQISLQARNRKFAGEKLKKRVGESQVTLAVLKKYRVYFVRHSGRADFPSFGFLPHPFVGNVSPDILVEINQDCVYLSQYIKNNYPTVMALYLGSN